MDSNKLSQFDYLKGKIFRFSNFSHMSFTYLYEKVEIIVGGNLYAIQGEELSPEMSFEELMTIEVISIDDYDKNIRYYG